jgi:hypothetical protein
MPIDGNNFFSIIDYMSQTPIDEINNISTSYLQLVTDANK